MAELAKEKTNTAEKPRSIFFDESALLDNFETLSGSFARFTEMQRRAINVSEAFVGVLRENSLKSSALQAGFVKAGLDDATAATRRVFSSKSIQEVFEIQSEYRNSALKRSQTFTTEMADLLSEMADMAPRSVAKSYSDYLECISTFRP